MAVKLSKGKLSGAAVPAGEAEETLGAALRDVSPPESMAAVETFVATLKQALKALRTARGIRQGELADALGLSTSTISRLEGDPDSPIDLAVLCEALQHLNIGLRYELLVDAPSMQVAVRPAAEVSSESNTADDRLAIAEQLRDIRQRIEAIEQNLGAALPAEGTVKVEVVPVGHERYRPLSWVAPLPKGSRRLTAEPAVAASGREPESARETSRLISADKVEGTSVYDKSGENVGTIKNVMIDKISGQVVYATMASGGVLGIGSDHFALPWNALTYNTNFGGYEIDMSRDKLQGAPAASESEVISKLEDQSFGSKVYDYYGTKPFKY